MCMRFVAVALMAVLGGCGSAGLQYEGDGGNTSDGGSSYCGGHGQKCCNVDAGLQQCIDGQPCLVENADTVNLRETCL